MSALGPELEVARRFAPERVTGRVASVSGMSILAADLPEPVGASVEIEIDHGAPAPAEVIGFTADRTILMPLREATGVRPGARVVGVRREASVAVGPALLGRVLDGMCEPIDGGARPRCPGRAVLSPRPIGPLERARVTRPLRTGVRAIDLMTPLGRGQRLGIFAGPGVGKSTLLGQIARGTSADVSVIALVGERGREVRDFVEESLGDEGLARSVVVAATGDESPLMRIRAARAACSIAESFRGMGLDVLLMMDSVTRFAHAQRQVGLASGEPPATRGYTPSVFAEMAKLLERAGAVEGAGSGGSVTGLYTILVEGDDMTEPVADAARGILDGHVILDRGLAQRGHFPAIDTLDSVSRVADAVMEPAHRAARQQLVALLAAYKRVEELVQIGAYASGSDAEADVAIALKPELDGLLRQATGEAGVFERDSKSMLELAMRSGEMIGRAGGARGA